MADSGPRFGRYRLQGRIAAGGMGEVFKATAQAFDGVQKCVAIKLIRTGLEGDPDLVKMFVEEAKVAFLLTHANLVQTFDVGTIDGQYFLAMEYVEGMTLSHVLRGCRDVLGQPMPQRHAVFIAVETLKGLGYAHRFKDGTGRALGIVHRDVSPSNILISLEGEVKVSDFGIAWSTMKTHRSQLGTIKGKVPYMPPEQVRGAPLDARADVYAVGAVLYENLCGRPPFLGPPGTIIPLVIDGRFPRPRELDAGIPEELEGIVLRAMAPDASTRYESAAAMRDELEELALRQAWRLSSLDLASFVRALDVPAPRAEGARAFDLALGEELRKIGEGQALSVFTSMAIAPQGAGRSAPELHDPGRASPAGGPGAGDPAMRPSADSLQGASPRTEPGLPTRDTTPDRPAVSVAAPAPSSSVRSPPPTQEPVSTGTGIPGDRPRRRAALIALYAAALVLVAIVGALAARSDEPRPIEPETPAPTATAVVGGRQPVEAATPDPLSSRTVSGTPPPVSPTSQSTVLPLGVEPPPVAAAVPIVVGTTSRADAQDGGTRSPPAAASGGSATIMINTEPWTFVEVDGVRIGPTPQRHRVRPGRRVLRLVNPARGISRTQVVVLREGEVRRIVLELSTEHEPGR